MGRKRREQNVPEDNDSDRRDDKDDRREDKHDYKLDKIDAKSQKAISTAMKRDSLSRLIKWVLIALGTFYALFKFGGFDLGGIMEKIKGITG